MKKRAFLILFSILFLTMSIFALVLISISQKPQIQSTGEIKQDLIPNNQIYSYLKNKFPIESFSASMEQSGETKLTATVKKEFLIKSMKHVQILSPFLPDSIDLSVSFYLTQENTVQITQLLVEDFNLTSTLAPKLSEEINKYLKSAKIL